MRGGLWLRRIGWFVALWLAGFAAVSALAWVIRLAILPAG
ncbi:DUF2474 domain-containing protein [Frigidibacter mobilis]|uniref:DUF2474 family protein n=1 Tax=Frigidibacter mobilis TaxID=1335048 RepID=A0A159Z0Z0_9RHOB|nr:DUF2474 domain-containing protein [Frigidibacter mobilis]AMY68575.1 hypothetical protein AKL17_1319 [Frigidibacter mobilis]